MVAGDTFSVLDMLRAQEDKTRDCWLFGISLAFGKGKKELKGTSMGSWWKP